MMRLMLFLSLLLAGSVTYAADGSVQGDCHPAIVQSLSTGIYRQATVKFEGHRATVRFSRGGQMILELDNLATTESEEIVGVDKDHNYWAVYVDKETPEPRPSISAIGAAPFAGSMSFFESLPRPYAASAPWRVTCTDLLEIG